MPLMRRLLFLLYGGVFVYAGAVKAWDPAAFVIDIRSFELLADPWAAWLAMGLPWLEISAGLAVMTGLLRSGGLLLLNACLLVFLAAILSAWARGLDIRCGCFGSSGTSAYTELLVRDLALLGLGLWLAFGRRRQKP